MEESAAEEMRLLAENEAAVSRLYRAYAEKFPNHRSFWIQLADEETDHSRWIRELGLEVDKGIIYLDKTRFKSRPMEIMLGHIRNQLARTQGTDVTLIEALSTALDIEQGLLERNFFEVFQTDSVRLKHLLLDLKNATKIHLQRVREAWDANRP